MCCVLLLILTTLFPVTVSQVQITADKINVKDGESVVLTCTVPDFTDNIIVIQGTSTNRALCFANSLCSSTDGSAYSVTKSGTNVIFTILSFSKTRDVGDWFVRYGTSNDSPPVKLSEFTQSPISQMSTPTATQTTTSVMITGSITHTSDMSTLAASYRYTGSKNFNPHTQSTIFYSNTEKTTSYVNTQTTNFDVNIQNTNFYANTETTNVYGNTENIEIQTKSSGMLSNSKSIYQSMVVTIAANNFSGSLESTGQKMTETFALPGYSLTSYNEIIIPSRLETSNVFPPTFSVSSISFSVDTISDDFFHNIHVSSGSLIATGSSKYSSMFITISPLMSTTFIDQISYSSKMEAPSFSSHQYFPESSVTLSKISVSSQLMSAILDTVDYCLCTTNTLITTSLDDTSILFDDLTNRYQTFSHDYSASTSTSLIIVYNSTDHHLSLQTTEYNESMQTNNVTTPLYEAHTDNAATGIYSKEITTSGKSHTHTRVMPSQTQLASMNGIQDSTIDFQSTYVKPYSLSNDEFFSSEISEYLLSTFQLTSFLLPLNTKANVSGFHSYMTTTNMSTFESQSVMLTTNPSLFTIPSSIQISTILLDFKPTILTTAISFNSKTILSMIQPSSKQTNSGISYNEIETSFKDSSFFLESFSDSLTSYDQDITSLSSGVFESIGKLSPNTIQSGLSEKNKTIIFITTTSAIITLIVVILLIILAKVYISKSYEKSCKEDDNISWSNNSIPPKKSFPDYSFAGKRIYPLLITSTASLKLPPYENNWNNIV